MIERVANSPVHGRIQVTRHRSWVGKRTTAGRLPNPPITESSSGSFISLNHVGRRVARRETCEIHTPDGVTAYTSHFMDFHGGR